MADEKRALLESICAVAAQHPGSTSGDRPQITKDEAISMLQSLLADCDLPSNIRRVQKSRKAPEIHRNTQYRQYWEIYGHTGMIERLCFDNSSRFAFSGSADGIIKIWHIEQGMLIRSLYGHSSCINDLCVSASGEYLVSADIQGAINVWCLKTFEPIHHFEMQSEVVFCEFFLRSENGARNGLKPHNRATDHSDAMDQYDFSCILANGLVMTIKFTRGEVVATNDNAFMLDANIKAICVTDGGRYVICGGWWPFILLYDTHNLDKVIVLEEFRTQTLCACKNGLKIAASCGDRIFVYTFYTESTRTLANFKKRKNAGGCWRRIVHAVDPSYSIERMAFLPSFALVTVDSVGTIRIYDDETMLLETGAELGCIYAHPTRDIFAIVGQSLSFYELHAGMWYGEFPEPALFSSRPTAPDGLFVGARDRSASVTLSRFFSTALSIGLNDCQFSPDGRFFITSDDGGVIRAYSAYEPIQVSSEQFFPGDFEFASSGPMNGISDQVVNVVNFETDSVAASDGLNLARDGTANDYAVPEEGQFDTVVDANRMPCRTWRRTGYEITSVASLSRAIAIESMAARYLERDGLGYSAFHRKYLSRETEKETIDSDSDTDSDDKTWDPDTFSSSYSGGLVDAYDDSGYSEDTDNSEAIITSDEDEESGPVRRLRKHVQPEQLITDSSPRLRRLRSTAGQIASDSDGDTVSSESEERPARRHLPAPAARRGPERTEVTRESRRSRAKRTETKGTQKREASPSTTHRTRATSSRRRGDHHDGADSEHDRHDGSFPPDGVILRRHRRRQEGVSLDKSPAKSGSRRSSTTRRLEMTQIENDSNVSDAGIDPHLESIITAHSREWLASFAVYVGDRVYFDSEAFSEFINLEPRLGEVSPPDTGVYTVTSREYRSIGSIPYLSIVLNNLYTVKFYEYPDGTGIMCLKSQLDESGHVSLMTEGALAEGEIVRSEGLQIVLSSQPAYRRFYRSSVITGGGQLSLREIEYRPQFKELFGRSRSRGRRESILKTVNYGVINSRIILGMYRKRKHLLSDLKLLEDIAMEQLDSEHQKFARLVARGY